MPDKESTNDIGNQLLQRKHKYEVAPKVTGQIAVKTKNETKNAYQTTVNMHEDIVRVLL